MNILFVIKVKILVLIKWSCRSPQLCWLMNLERVSYFGATPYHMPLIYTCPIRISNWIRRVYLTLQCPLHQSEKEREIIPLERRLMCRVMAPNPPNEMGDWIPLASPTCTSPLLCYHSCFLIKRLCLQMQFCMQLSRHSTCNISSPFHGRYSTKTKENFLSVIYQFFGEMQSSALKLILVPHIVLTSQRLENNILEPHIMTSMWIQNAQFIHIKS